MVPPFLMWLVTFRWAFVSLSFSRACASNGVSSTVFVLIFLANQLHASRCRFPRPILFSQLVDPTLPGSVHLDFIPASGPFPRLQLLVDFFSLPSTAPDTQYVFLLLATLVSLVSLVPSSYRWQTFSALSCMQGVLILFLWLFMGRRLNLLSLLGC